MTVRDVCAAIESLAPREYAYAWDRVGLHIGDPSARVEVALVALTLTRKVFNAAVQNGAQMIVTHHPALAAPLQTLRTDDPAARLCLDIAHAGIACYAAHTNLDVAPGGMNDALAARLELSRVEPLLAVPQAQQIKLVTFVPASHLARVREAVCGAGAGVIGNYSYCTFGVPGFGTFRPGAGAAPHAGKKHRLNEEPEIRFETVVPAGKGAEVVAALKAAHPYEEVAYDLIPLANPDPAAALGVHGELIKPLRLGTFAQHVRKKLNVSHVRAVGALKKRIRYVAVIGGSGAREYENMPPGVDVLVTGDVRYHDAVAAVERGLALVDPGHAGMEKWVVPVLARHLRKTCKSLRVATCQEREMLHFITE